jgi:hypothetical protein
LRAGDGPARAGDGRGLAGSGVRGLGARDRLGRLVHR